MFRWNRHSPIFYNCHRLCWTLFYLTQNKVQTLMNMMGRPLSLMLGFTVLYPLLLFAKRNKKRKKVKKRHRRRLSLETFRIGDVIVISWSWYYHCSEYKCKFFWEFRDIPLGEKEKGRAEGVEGVIVANLALLRDESAKNRMQLWF